MKSVQEGRHFERFWQRMDFWVNVVGTQGKTTANEVRINKYKQQQQQNTNNFPVAIINFFAPNGGDYLWVGV